MHKSSKTILVYRILMYVTLVLFFLFIAALVVGSLLPKEMFNGHRPIMFSVVTILAFIAAGSFSLSAKVLHDKKAFNDNLKIENQYTLGKQILLYNLEAFKNKANSLRRKRKYAAKDQYLIVFSPTALDISSNAQRNKLVSDLNLHLAEFITELFSKNEETEFNSKFNTFGFSRGVFLFYCFNNDESYVHRLMNRISNECFKMVNEGKVRIWVQPFYGIKRVDESKSITTDVEDALIARNESEKNFESFTYFRDSFKDNSGSEVNEVSAALQNDEFIPFYQAKYSLKENRFISSEVLARWKSEKYGLVGPSKFIDQAEKAGVLNAIDIRIFELAVKDLSENIKRGRRVLPISVNFSLYEFFSNSFLPMILDTLKKYQVPAKLLEIEITETTSQANKFLSLSVIRKLKDLGVRVLMDDFGVGYSQISNLKEIPFDAIKIDKSFINNITEDEKARSIVKFLVELAHTNNMEAIVEGVETKEQLAILKKMKVDTIQGFYYTRPLSLSGYNALLKQNQFEKEVKK